MTPLQYAKSIVNGCTWCLGMDDTAEQCPHGSVHTLSRALVRADKERQKLQRQNIKYLSALKTIQYHLESTRWMGTGKLNSMKAWAATPEGLNHDRIIHALNAKRVLLALDTNRKALGKKQ